MIKHNVYIRLNNAKESATKTESIDTKVFEHKGSTNLLFLFGNTPMDIGKLAIWRLQTYAQFGGTWLSDYVPNQLGGFRMVKMRDKPDFMLCDAL